MSVRTRSVCLTSHKPPLPRQVEALEQEAVHLLNYLPQVIQWNMPSERTHALAEIFLHMTRAEDSKLNIPRH